jgi:hypothetical protein
MNDSNGISFPTHLPVKQRRGTRASFEVEGNWNKLTKKFCEKFFPISKV